jgi:predicted nucleic acid-binding protein
VTRFVIGPDVALRLARDRLVVAGEHRLVAPTLLRSQLLSNLYQAVRAGEMDRKEADRVLDHVRGLRIRLLGDRVLQSVAWTVADRLNWPDTLTAEYVALTQLQADAFVTLDPELAAAVRGLVTTAPIEALAEPDGDGQRGA